MTFKTRIRRGAFSRALAAKPNIPWRRSSTNPDGSRFALSITGEYLKDVIPKAFENESSRVTANRILQSSRKVLLEETALEAFILESGYRRIPAN